MRDGPARRPGAVPDRLDEAPGQRVQGHGVDVTGGADTDVDGRPDTLLTTDDDADLLVWTDLDGDGLADRVLQIGPDGLVHVATTDHPLPGAPDPAPDGPVAGHAPAAPGPGGPLGRLLGRLFGLDP